MSQEESHIQKRPVVGRTWVDLVFTSGYGFIILGFIALILYLGYRAFGSLPQWVFLSIGMSLIFIPFLFERAKEDSRIFLVVDEPLRLTEYRIGSKVDLNIEGFGVEMLSKSGCRRTVLKSFDPYQLTGAGSPLGEFSQFEQIRQLSTLRSLADKLEETLQEERLSSMHIGIEVEKQSKEIVDWALKFAYGSAIPHELTDALGVSIDEEQINETLEDLLS